MSPRKYRNRMVGLAVAVLAVWSSLTPSANAQEQWQTRTWPELKAETQARADRNAYPLTGLKPDDVREALSHIDSLDRDQWAAAWMTVGDRYMSRAAGELAQHPDAARDDYHSAWLNYAFGRWPSPNSPGKQKS